MFIGMLLSVLHGGKSGAVDFTPQEMNHSPKEPKVCSIGSNRVVLLEVKVMLFDCKNIFVFFS